MRGGRGFVKTARDSNPSRDRKGADAEFQESLWH
jgi:hypothetical protein